MRAGAERAARGARAALIPCHPPCACAACTAVPQAQENVGDEDMQQEVDLMEKLVAASS